MLHKVTKGKSIGRTIRRLEDHEGSKAYDEVIKFFNKHGTEGGVVTAAYDKINHLKVKRVTCDGMALYLNMLEKQFDALHDEGKTVTEKFKRDHLIKGIVAKDYQNLIMDMRTHEEWDYKTCAEKFRLLGGALE